MQEIKGKSGGGQEGDKDSRRSANAVDRKLAKMQKQAAADEEMRLQEAAALEQEMMGQMSQNEGKKAISKSNVVRACNSSCKS